MVNFDVTEYKKNVDVEEDEAGWKSSWQKCPMADEDSSVLR